MKCAAFSLALLSLSFTSLGEIQPGEGAMIQVAQEGEAAQRAVLITGASSGIGRKTAEVLAAEGFYVYAGARKEKDLKELSAIPNIEGVRLDVTVQSEIDKAVETVRAGGRGLYGLINNAGVAALAPLIELSDKDFDFVMDVNVSGPFKVSKAFAPLLIESKGRISTTGSISGVLAWPMGGVYCMSKHAMEAFSDCLGVELASFGVPVSIVEPGNYKSSISASVYDRAKESGYASAGSLYKERMDQMLGKRNDRSEHKDPDEVADAFLRFLTDDKPQRRYMVVPNQSEADMTVKAALSRFVELNAHQPYSYDREGLIELLDEALANLEK
ncbi:MAG: NAD(P)-dependent dehydrogenase (short-subunit alcohol dehydrogenase family) [Planctomycetota bacterium]|jgi:NAD(P)-dependent dehydrogenase (short-subunit alcohol dehydrogenase family)